jgi:hypothetical protein
MTNVAPQPLKHFFVRDHLDLAGIDFVDAALDLFGPSGCGTFVLRRFIEASSVFADYPVG